MPVRIAVIAEAPADFRHVTDLIDRKVRDHAPTWWDEHQLDVEREYCGLEAGTKFTCWRELRSLSVGRGLLRRGGISNPDLPQRFRFDYPLGRKALIRCAQIEPRPDLVLLIRDMDQQPRERRESLEALRDENAAQTLQVLLALPCAKREAWALAGWAAQNDIEEAALAKIRAGLAFHPCERAEELDAMEHGAVRDAKRVLAALTAGDHAREIRCWTDAPWTMLRARGQHNGLASFLAEVKDKLVPRILA